MPAAKPEPDSAPDTTTDAQKKTSSPTAAPAPAATSAARAAEPATATPPDDVPAGRLPAGVYEYVWPVPTQYLEVPLTARPADPGRPAEGDDPGVPATPATVFHWPFSAPDDGRWQPTKQKPNQVADNAAAPSSTED